MKLSEYLKKNNMTTEEYFERQKRRSKGVTTLTDYRRDKKNSLSQTINFDTFEADLNSMGTTIQGIYDGWQTQDTMSKTKTTVEAMQARINAYQDYQKMFGGADLSELASSYKSVLDNWDNVSTMYSQYKDADSYNVAKKNAMFDEQFKGLTYGDVQSKLKEYATDSDEYKYLSGYTNYSDLNDFDEALKNATGDYKSKLQKIRNQYALDNKFDLYKGYTEAEDFGEKSQYWDGHSWATDNFTSARSAASKDHSIVYDKKSKTYYVYSDPLYEYVNDKNNARKNLTQGVMKGDYSKLGLEYSNKGYDKLTDEEIAVFNYIDATEGHDKAVEYLEEMSTTLTKRKYDKQTQDWNKAADSGVLADIGLSVATVPANIVGAMGNAFATVDEFIKGEEYNPYHRYRMVGNFATDTRGYISENIAEATEGVELFGQNVPSFLYDTGMSIGDTALGTLTTGKLYSVFAGTNAYQQKAKELVEAGEDESKVFYTALASGAAEMVFEYLSIDKLLKIKNVDSAASLIKNTLKQAGVEGSEELFTEIANIVSDSAIRGKSSELYQMYEDLKGKGYSTKEINTEIAKQVGGQIGWSFTGGALSGGVMGGGASAKSYSEMSSLGKGIKGNGRTADMLDIAGLTPQESEAYKAYTSYANKGINADNISNARLGNLYATTEEGARKTLSSKKSTLEQKRGATETLKKLSVVDEKNTVSKDTINQIDRNISVREAYMESADELIATGLESGKDTKSYKLATEYKQKLDNGIELTEKEIANLVKANSEAITAEDVATLSEEDAALFKSVYDGKTDKSDFFHSFELVKTLTENNYSADYILEHKGVLSAKQVSAIYKAKVLSSDASLEKAITALKEKHEGTAFIEGTFDDSVINYDNTNVEGKVNWNSLNSNQKKAIAVLGQVGKRAGMDVELISDGLERGINGAFEISGNKMLIDIYAGMDKVDGSKLQDTIIPTTSHEMTHWMKSKSPTLYRKYDNYVFGTLTMSGKSESDILSARRKKMEDAHPGEKFTDAEVRDEVIARASEDMFAKSEEIKNFLNTLTDSEKKSFVEKVKEILQNVKEWLNDFLSKQKSTSDEAKIIRQYADRIDGQIELWDKMLISSISANQALKKEGITGEKLANKTSNNVQEMARDRYWYPQMSNTDLAYVRRIAKYELPKTDNYLDENTKWLYNVKNGNTYFALYSTSHEDNPTVLYACKGNQAKNEYAWFMRFIEELRSVDNGDYEQSTIVLNQMLEAFRNDYGANNRSVGNGLGRRSNLRNVRTTNQRTNFRPCEALLDCLKNIGDIQKRNEQNKLEQYSDRDTLESRYSELQKEYTQLEKEAEALKQSKEYLDFLDSISLLQGEELDNAIKEYGEWTHKSGLYDKSKRMSEIIGEQKDIRAALDNEKELSRDAYMKSIENLTEKEKMDFVNKAVKRFGTTNRVSLASYLMLNGKMLDFSEGQGYRVQDHREISEILDMPDTTGYSDGLIAFMNMGNIRMQTYGIDISQAPNQAQKSALRDIISQIMRNEDEFTVDFSKTSGYTDGSVTYPKGTATSKILADIDSYFETGVLPEYESSIAEFRYSDRDSNIETQINQSMTMAECKDMIQRAFVLGGIYDWYDGEYKNGDEWLKAQGADEVALYIENEYALQQKYIDKIQGVIDDEFYVADILEAYLKGTLIGKEKPKTKRLDLSVNHRINDTRFYSPQRIENVKQLFEVASQKLTSKNRAEVSNARAKILLFAHNKGASELLGLTQAELNKKLRSWGGYPANARDMSRRFNNGVADSNKWTGIENCSWLYRSTVTTDELESLVKSVTGAADDYEKLYIARTMLALDTHIDWSWVTFEFDSHANVNKNRNKNDRCNGFYSNDKRKVVVSHNMPNTVAHEMGHALDYQWGRDLGYQYDALTEVSQNTQRITDPQTKQFFDNFKIFMDSLTDNGDIRSEYTQNPKEVFARFIARFVEWVDNTGTGNHSYRTESMYYNDKFTASNYIEFVKLLQEKAMLDSRKVAEGDDVKFSDRDIEVYDRTAILKESTIDKYLEEYAAKSSPNYAQAYITYMTPDNFLKMTTSNKSRIEAESKEFNYDKFTDATLFQPIQLIIDSKTGEVNGHEGRHRMVALSNAGVYNVPVLMFDYSNKTNKENISEMVLHGQFNPYLTTRVQDVIPFSYSNREEIIKNFGTQSSWQKMKERYDGEKTLMYSDRDNVSVYDTMGETDRLIKENTQLKEDVERLKERLKLERQITNGNHFNENQLNAVAAHIRNIAKSSYSKPELVNLLKGVYSYIATSKDLNWQDMFAQCYDIASMVLNEARPVTETNEYYKWILNDIRGTKISVNEQQIQNARYKLGNRWRNAFFNKVKITDNAISLDRKWQEWSNAYPDLFDAEISDADQLIELYDIYDSVREGSELVVEYDIEEQTRWLAREIYNQYWNVSPIRTTAEKYDKQIKLLNYKHREAMNQLRSNYEDRLKSQHKADRQKAIKLVKEIRERKDKEIAEVKKHSKERMDAYKDNAARKTKIQSITAKALTLNEWLIKNSKEKHIHESLKAPVANLLQAIDFSSQQLLGMRGGKNKGMPTQKDISLQRALSQVKDMMLEASVGKEELIDLYGHDLDDDIKLLVESVDNIMRTVGDNEFILNQMTLNDLNTLDNMLKTIKQAVTKMNQFHSVHHARGIASLGQEEIRYAEKLGNEKVYVEGSLKSGTNKMLKWTNSVPYYAFKRFGEAGKKIFEAFQDGWDKMSFNVKEVIDFTKKTYKSKEVKEWEKEIKSFDVLLPATDSEKSDPNFKPKSQKVQMTTAQVMYLYLLNKRASAKAHLLGGGIVVSNIETKKNEVISQPEGVLLEQSEIDKIIQSLNKRQLEVADALSKFMNTVCSDWGNEVSMARFGYKAFGEPDYVPMQPDKDEISTADPAEKNNSLFKLLNVSFTHSLTPGANNRLVISSIFDVFAQHTSDMAKYNALALPVLDAFKWYNYKEIEYVGEEAKVRNTVKKSIGKAFGKDGQSYITTLLEDINGQNSLSRDKMSVRFFKNSKLASVGMNLRVILLQPTSYFRASANIDNKYLIKALAHKPKIAHAEKYCGMALWKSLGYYDTNIQRGVAEQIKHAETGYDKLIEWSMKGAGEADRRTLGYLWNAAELEIRKTRKDLKVGSEEFFLEVGKRLRDIIYSTQVVDSTLTRSEFMRSPDGRDKILSMFASEPTLAYNILQDAYIQTSLDARELGSKKAAFKKNGKKIAKAITAYTVTNAVAALVESGFDALRDDDDEEMDIAEFMKLYLANFAADMSIVGKVPYLKDGLSILQGYSPSRSDLQWIESAYKTYTGITKHLQGEGNPVTTIKNSLKTFSYVSGLPFYNAYRDIMATLNKLDILSSEELEEMFKDLFGIE